MAKGKKRWNCAARVNGKKSQVRTKVNLSMFTVTGDFGEVEIPVKKLLHAVATLAYMQMRTKAKSSKALEWVNFWAERAGEPEALAGFAKEARKFSV